MRLRIFLAFIFYLFFFGQSSLKAAEAELSVTNQWRIEQSVERCGESNNALIFPEYWGDSVTDENRETVCMAEQFAKLVASDGEGWLNGGAVPFINQCKTQSQKDDGKYFKCLEIGLKKITKQLSSPCIELGEEGLWEEARCRRLVSYIFIQDFEKVLQANRPLLKKLMENKTLLMLFGPISAIIFLVLYVLDIVILTDPGNWMRVPRFGLIVGTIILVCWFLEGELRFIGMSLAVMICAGGIIRNHIAGLFKQDKKKRRYPSRRGGGYV